MKEVIETKNISAFKSEKGASLIEMLIVFIIISILCVIAIPQITASLQYNRINTINALIASKLSEARIQAIKRNSPVSLKINFQTRKIWLESGSTQIGARESFTSENTIQFSAGATSTLGTVTFNSFGNLQTTPTTIKVVNTSINRSKPLQVSLTGKITVGGMTAAQ
jgi:Tfp pilus assembly protein FimT